MNAVDRVCEIILAGEFQRAFPKIKPCGNLGFMVFSLDYNRDQNWSVYVYQDFWGFPKCVLERKGIKIDLDKREQKALAKAIDFAYDKSMNDWRALHAHARENF